jgi:hypothetical protein
MKEIAAGHIFIPALKKKELTKKQKALKDKSLLLVGYQLGFSKITYKDLIKQKAKRSKFNERSSILFPRKKRQEGKNVKKKK